MSIQIRIDNRVRVQLSEVPAEVLEPLKQDFTYANPEWATKRAIGVPTWGVDAHIKTWRVEGTELSFPRGGYRRVRARIERHGYATKTLDARHEGSPCARFPSYQGPALRYYQVEALRAAVAKQNCIVRAPTGCVSGDTVVEINRAGISRKITIADLVVWQHGGRPQKSHHKKGRGGGKCWDTNITTKVRMRTEDGFIRLGTLRDVWESGTKRTFRLATKGGFEVRATVDHRFLVERAGEIRWVKLGRLHVGDRVFVDGGVQNGPRRKKNWYQLVSGVKAHPYAGRRGVKPGKGGWSVPKHRLVMEAILNGLPYDAYVALLKRGDIAGLVFLDPREIHVHHLDEDPRNNDPANLAVIPKKEHHVEHGRAGGWQHVTARTITDEIVAIDDPREEMTYDLEVAEGDHNFLANGIVAHNSGKSLLAIALAAEIGLNTIVILPTVALFKQWCDDACSALKLKPSDLGVVHGNKRDLRPLTVAVQGTLASRGIDEEMRDFFGVVIVDETQKAAAKTYIEAIDPFPAKYRFGISADERRKDRKEFLTHDLFADVAYEISRRDLEHQGFIVDVEIRVVPTAFDAPWFGVVGEGDETSEREGVNFKRLIDEMTADDERNAQAIEHALHEVNAGNQVILLSHRREHCQLLDRAFVERGVRSGFFIGGADYAREFDATRKGIESGSVRVGVGTYGALGYGVNLPSVAAGVAATPIGGNKQNFNQVRGRLCRLGKSSARLYVLWDWKVYPGHLANMIAWNPTVRVLERGKWVEAEAWRKRHKDKLRRAS